MTGQRLEDRLADWPRRSTWRPSDFSCGSADIATSRLSVESAGSSADSVSLVRRNGALAGQPISRFNSSPSRSRSDSAFKSFCFSRAAWSRARSTSISVVRPSSKSETIRSTEASAAANPLRAASARRSSVHARA